MSDIFPFANLEIGQCFMYDSAPYMKIGSVSCKGTFLDFSINAVGLTTGYLVKFDNTNLVRLVDNQWKGYKPNEKEENYE